MKGSARVGFLSRSGSAAPALVLAVAAAAAACGGSTLGPKDGGGAGRSSTGASDAGTGGASALVWTFSETVDRDIDILFMVDDSLGASVVQTRLASNFPAFIQSLRSLPGGFPNVHIGVISSSMGSGRFEVPNCPAGGDRGRLHVEPRGTCLTTGLVPGTENFISSIDGLQNYLGVIEDVFTCISQLGGSGCGFEQPLAALVRALGADGAPPPPENAGFLRPNAALSIVIVTDEDDCSMPDDSDLADPSSKFVSDPLGPLSSFRCNEYGHLCNGAPPPRTRAASFDPGACVPAEEKGKLTPVAQLARQIRGLKTDPSRVLVSVIGGAPDPYDVELVAPQIQGDPAMWPAVRMSCTNPSTGQYAAPGVRLAAFAQAFGPNGVFLSACADSYAPAFQRIAEETGRTVGPHCVDQPVRLVNGQPDCVAVETSYLPDRTPVTTPLPPCATSPGAGACWGLADGDAQGCLGALRLEVHRQGQGTPPSGAWVKLACVSCAPDSGTADCR